MDEQYEFLDFMKNQREVEKEAKRAERNNLHHTALVKQKEEEHNISLTTHNTAQHNMRKSRQRTSRIGNTHHN